MPCHGRTKASRAHAQGARACKRIVRTVIMAVLVRVLRRLLHRLLLRRLRPPTLPAAPLRCRFAVSSAGSMSDDVLVLKKICRVGVHILGSVSARAQMYHCECKIRRSYG